MNSLLSFWQKAPVEWDSAPTIPPGHRVYAVGDVHGHDLLLGELLALIEADIAARQAAQVTIVFLGDLIDRGPSSAAVVERLRTYRPLGVRVEFLAGNHEEVLLRILNGEGDLLADWLRFGGAQCARSYGLRPSNLMKLPVDRAIAALRLAIPATHQAFLASFSDSLRAGDYYFVHAGIRPGIPLGEQAQSDLRWIRGPFLDHPVRHEAMIVHGHTVRSEVEETLGRIGIDTGAYVHGVLTAIGLEGDQRWYLQARHNASATLAAAR
ncbi:MAG: metallophosphoesterase [Sphingomicrobium sp.]